VDAVPVDATAEQPTDVGDLAAAAAAQTADLLRRFRPGQNLDDEIAAYEREQAAAATIEPSAAASEPASAEPEPAVPVEAPPETVAAELATQELVAAELATQEPPEPVETAPEPVLATPEPVSAETTTPEPVAPGPRDDVVAQPTWQIVAPDSPPVDGLAAAPQAPEPGPPASDQVAASAEPQWPVQPEWPSQGSAAGLPFLGRPVAPTGGIEALWAESAREVVSAPAGPATRTTGGVQPCVSCGLSLSANARFCRRCGSRQA
ncbi:MAG: hypothetical protein ACRDIL_04590, partial [Candidatus Limnocylindrales bacterium]